MNKNSHTAAKTLQNFFKRSRNTRQKIPSVKQDKSELDDSYLLNMVCHGMIASKVLDIPSNMILSKKNKASVGCYVISDKSSCTPRDHYESLLTTSFENCLPNSIAMQQYYTKMRDKTLEENIEYKEINSKGLLKYILENEKLIDKLNHNLENIEMTCIPQRNIKQCVQRLYRILDVDGQINLSSTIEFRFPIKVDVDKCFNLFIRDHCIEILRTAGYSPEEDIPRVADSFFKNSKYDMIKRDKYYNFIEEMDAYYPIIELEQIIQFCKNVGELVLMKNHEHPTTPIRVLCIDNSCATFSEEVSPDMRESYKSDIIEGKMGYGGFKNKKRKSRRRKIRRTKRKRIISKNNKY